MATRPRFRPRRTGGQGVTHLRADGSIGPLPLRAIEWHTNSVRVELAAGVAGALRFAQPFYPGWTA